MWTPRCSRVEVDRAGDLGEDELLVPAAAQPDRLVHAPDAGAGQADSDLGLRGLEVGRRRSVRSIYAPQTYQGETVTDENDLLQARQPRVPRPAHAARDRLRLRANDRADGGARSEARRLLGDDRGGVAAARRARSTSSRSPRGSRAGATSRSSMPVSTGELAAAAAERLGRGAGRQSPATGADGRHRRGRRRSGRCRRSSSARSATAVWSRSTVVADGTELRVSPITPASAPVVLGEDLRDLGAAVAVMHVQRARRLGRGRRRDADDPLLEQLRVVLLSDPGSRPGQSASARLPRMVACVCVSHPGGTRAWTPAL